MPAIKGRGQEARDGGIFFLDHGHAPNICLVRTARKRRAIFSQCAGPPHSKTLVLPGQGERRRLTAVDQEA